LYGSKTKKSRILPLDETDELTKENIKNAIDEGAGFVNFAGHGNHYTWATHPPDKESIWLPQPYGYLTGDISSLSNDGRYPVVILNACSCGKFTEDNSIAWRFVEIRNKGAIASIATTALSWGYISSYCIEGLSGYVNVQFFRAYKNGYRTLGETFGRAIKYYLDNSPEKDDSDTKPLYYKTAEEWILLGDPSLKLGEDSLKNDFNIELIEPQTGHFYLNGKDRGKILNKDIIIAIGDLTLTIAIKNPNKIDKINTYRDDMLVKEVEKTDSDMIKITLDGRSVGFHKVKVTAKLTNGESESKEITIFQIKLI
jgi:hypothetical protein